MTGNLVEKLRELLGVSPSKRVILTRSRVVSEHARPPEAGRIGLRREQDGVAERSTRPLWYVKGWRQDLRDPNRYFGEYQKSGRYYRGEIVTGGRGPRPFIYNPPTDTLRGPHRMCFEELRQLRAGYYSIHLPTPAQSIEEAIHAVELVL